MRAKDDVVFVHNPALPCSCTIRNLYQGADKPIIQSIAYCDVHSKLSNDPRQARSLCSIHPGVNYKKEWGCPECVRELRTIADGADRERDYIRSVNATALELLARAGTYLSHPDVAKIPFALNATNLAATIARFIADTSA